jgi:hypothetical protein
MDPTSPEILKAGEIFRPIISYRINLLQTEEQWAEAAYANMTHIHDSRETHARNLLVSSFARNARHTDIIGNITDIRSEHDRDVASAIPTSMLPVDQAYSEEHVAYIRDLYEEAKNSQETPSVEVQKLAEIRHDIDSFYADNEQFSRA